MPAIDAVLTMWPPSPWARMCGRKAADAVQHAHQVDVEHPSPVVERDVVDAAAGGDAGIVADHMDISERLEGRLGRALDAGGIGDVAGDAAHVGPDIAQAFDGRCQRARARYRRASPSCPLPQRRGRAPARCRWPRRSRMPSCRQAPACISPTLVMTTACRLCQHTCSPAASPTCMIAPGPIAIPE